MTIAIWIIAIVEVIRAIQNAIQLKAINNSERKALEKRAYEEFIASLKQTDKEFVEKMLKECEKELGDNNG